MVDVPKCLFTAEDEKYLGHILTRHGIKPQFKKVTVILTLKSPSGVKSLRHFLGLVQYYQDIWEKRSDILASLTDLVSNCGVTKSKKKKAKPRYWTEIHENAFTKI